MNNKEYVDLVNKGEYPKDIVVPLDKPFEDHRGVIQNLWLGNSGSITFIKSKKDSVRAKHLHSSDFHGCYIIEGQIRYIEGEGQEQTETIFNTGQLFFTRPGIYHEMHFLTDCKMITINNLVKDHINYEQDVIRK